MTSVLENGNSFILVIFKLVQVSAHFEADNLDQGCCVGVSYVLVEYCMS